MSEFPTRRCIPFWNHKNTLLNFSVVLAICLGLSACQPPPPPSSKPDSSATATQSTTQAESQGKDTAYFAERLIDLSRWSHYRPTEKSFVRSSHTDSEAEDADIYAGKDYQMDGATWHTLLDEQGPGCITRMWISEAAQGRLQFYFDNEQKPRYETTIRDFFTGGLKAIAPNLILSSTDTSCGQVSYFPMPFKKNCTILCDSSEPGLKYQINLLKLPENEEVISFQEKMDKRTTDALKKVNDFLSTPAIQKYLTFEKQEVSVTLKPDQFHMMVNLPGPGAIDYFEIQLKTVNMDLLTNIQLEMYWDGMDSPSVLCNLRQFFCNLDFERSWNSIPLGFFKDENKLYCQFYMPFKEKAQIFLKNLNKEPVDIIFRYHVDIDPKKLPEDPLYLYVRTNQQSFYDGLNYPLIEFEGRGNFVGLDVISYTESKTDKFFYLEGDEYVFVDGEAQPVELGTGMENYFNMDNHLSTTSAFWFPTHGCLAKINSDNEIDGQKVYQSGSNLYRFNLLDDIPFCTSIMMVQETGCPIKYVSRNAEPGGQTLFNWICYWYGQQTVDPVPRREQAFYFKISDKEIDAPTVDSPIMLGTNLHIQIPQGTWWVHFAPVWNLNDVKHAKQEIQ